jgi:hypothetical protein
MSKRVKKLQQFFEENEFNVHLFKQDNKQCAEIEKWTNIGVDMIICLNPFTAEEFKNYVKEFNVDDEIDLHRQDKRYCKDFTVRQSVEDFEHFHNHLQEIAAKLI